MLRWEELQGAEGQEAAQTLLEMVKLTRDADQKAFLLRRLADRYPDSLAGLRAKQALLYYDGVPLEERQQHLVSLVRAAGGPPDVMAALDRTSPVSLEYRQDKEAQQNLLFSLLEDIATNSSDQNRHLEARRVWRFMRVQFGSHPAEYRDPLDWLFDYPNGDTTAPMITPLYPTPNRISRDSSAVLFQLEDPGPDESFCDLSTLRAEMDGKEITSSLTREHFINIYEDSETSREKILLSFRYDAETAPGRHRMSVEIADNRGFPAARSWDTFVFQTLEDPELIKTLEESSDETILALLQAEPRYVWLQTKKRFDNWTMLQLACRRNLTKTAKYLLANDFPATFQYSSYVPIGEAAWHGNQELVTLLLDSGSPNAHQALQAAAQRGRVEMVAGLLARGVRPKPDQRMLHGLASQRELLPCFRLLLPYVSDIDQEDSEGQTALSRARDPEVWELLLNAGANLNHRDKRAQSVMHHVCRDQPNPENLRYLLEKGVDAIGTDSAGLSALHYLCGSRRADPESVRLLLSAGADPNLATPADSYRGRWTPLHQACSARNTEAIKVLLEAGADPSVKDAQGRTPLMLAGDEGAPEEIQQLLRDMADF